MSLRRIGATALRILQQLHHDHRTIALVLLLPSILLILLRFVFDNAEPAFRAAAPMMLGIFPFTVMFLVTSVSMLRERTSGTLEHLMTMPMSKLDLLLGYALAFLLLVILQGALASYVAVEWLDVSVEGSWLALLSVVVLIGLTGMATGLFMSAFARSEFQAVQFMPAVVMPQVLMCGLFVPRDQMAAVLEQVSNVMPLTYAVEAVKTVAKNSGWPSDLTGYLLILGGFALVALLAGAVTLRRRS